MFPVLRWLRCERSEPRNRCTSAPRVAAPHRLAILLVSLLLPLLSAGSAAAADRTTPTDGVWPLQPRPQVVERFDPPATRWGSGHRGVDLAGHVGQRVRAALPGRVSFAGRLAGRGVVVVDHGGTRTTYEPVLAAVSVGDTVDAGATIGVLQVFGSHCFPRSCLHWGLIQGRDHYLDPLTLVGGGPVRLLPLTGGLAGPVAPGLLSPKRPAARWTPPAPTAPPTSPVPLPTSLPRPAAFGQAALPPTDRAP